MVVRMRHTRAHTANRRSHHALTAPRLSACVECKAMHVRHRACPSCGTYRGKAAMASRTVAARPSKKAAVKA